MDENFSVLSDPDFLALRRRVREELEHTPEHEISSSLAARYARLDEEFLRRASLAWTQTANELGETKTELPEGGQAWKSRPMTLAAKGSRSVTVDDVRYRWRMGRGPGPLSFAVDVPGQAGSVLVVRISDCPRTRWCDDGEGLVAAPALVAAVIRLALERGWKPDVRGPQFRLEVQSSEVPKSVKTVARHFNWCCGSRVMALLGTGKPAVPGT